MVLKETELRAIGTKRSRIHEREGTIRAGRVVGLLRLQGIRVGRVSLQQRVFRQRAQLGTVVQPVVL